MKTNVSELDEHVRAMIARILRCPIDELDADRPLNTIGLDSILAVELRNRIELERGVRVPMLAILRGTPARIAARVREQQGGAAPAAAPRAPAPVVAAAATAPPSSVRPSPHRSVRRPPRAGEVEIEVHAAGLTHGAIIAAGEDTSGFECSGEITAVGDGVTGVRIGDAVVAAGPGALGTHVVTSAAFVVPKPTSLGHEQAAAVPAALMSAHHAIHALARVRRGERVLVHSAAGATGLFAVHLARQAGAEVFATAGTPEKIAYLRALGVAHTMDSRSLGFAEEVRDRTGGAGVDVVINAHDPAAAGASLALLRPYGRFVETGTRDPRDEAVVTLAPFRNSLSYFAFDVTALARHRPTVHAALLREALQLIERGVVEVPPLTIYPMANTAEALATLSRATHLGKLVLRAKGTS